MNDLLLEPRCAHPDRLWGVCGIPEPLHEEMFAWAKGTRFFHEYVAPATTLVCRVCKSAHFDGPGTDGTVSLADYPDHQPVYEDEDAAPAAPGDGVLPPDDTKADRAGSPQGEQ